MDSDKNMRIIKAASLGITNQSCKRTVWSILRTTLLAFEINCVMYAAYLFLRSLSVSVDLMGIPSELTMTIPSTP